MTKFNNASSRIAIGIEYEGTHFKGFQKQKKPSQTIQGKLEKALSKIADEKINTICSGRTDTGVHALEQSAHFDYGNKINNLDKFIKSINFFLNKKKISKTKIKKKKLNFHARYSANQEFINI